MQWDVTKSRFYTTMNLEGLSETTKNLMVIGITAYIIWRLKNSASLVHKLTMLTGQPPLVDEVSANFCG
jgi:hypothetical protein